MSLYSASSPVTPKSTSLAFNFGHESSDVSPSQDSVFPYFEFDSEEEAFYSSLNHPLVSLGAMDSQYLAADKRISYGELMKNYVQCEEELRTTSLKLQESAQEIDKLKAEAKERESVVLLAENLRAELETAQREIETRDVYLVTRESQVLELQRQVALMETKLSDSSFKYENLVNDLVLNRERSDAEILELREWLSNCKLCYYTEKAKLQTDIAGLLANESVYDALIKELESRGEELEQQILHYDAENMERQRKEVELQDEVNALKADLAFRGAVIEALNEDYGEQKVICNMLMGKKDTDLENLEAEMRSRDIKIEQMEEQLRKLRYKYTNLMFESGNDKNSLKELRATVKELEKQTELQRNAIAEGEKENRGVIIELSLSLEHYKSEYMQLLAFANSF